MSCNNLFEGERDAMAGLSHPPSGLSWSTELRFDAPPATSCIHLRTYGHIEKQEGPRTEWLARAERPMNRWQSTLRFAAAAIGLNKRDRGVYFCRLAMHPPKFSLLCGLLAGYAVAPYAQEVPVLTGYVTRTTSPSDFDVNGVRILCGGKDGEDSKLSHDVTVAVVACPGEAPHLGDSFAIHYSVRNTAMHAIYASRIDKQHTSTSGGISGSAVIDAMPDRKADGGKQTELNVRADGYRIRITANTKIDWSSPLQSLADVKAGDWIKYKGKIDAAGVLVAASGQIGPNAMGGGEKKLRTNHEYDPSAIPADAKQNYLKDALTVGYDPKKFPPFKDVVLQARIERIGNSLVPAYQRALPASDPARTDFRFQLIDTKLFRDAFTLSSGIILVPHQVAEMMENDSQLAAVLADGIARVLERQEYRMEGKIKTGYASMLAMPISPYAGVGGLGGNMAMEMQKRAMEQRSRVSLFLLQDAGYDVAQAPMAWWLLAAGRPEPFSNSEVPERAAYLYRILGETWRDSAVPATAAP